MSGVPAPIDRAVRTVRERFRQPVFTGGAALVASTLATSALGAVYWLIAARRYDTDDVGTNAALISTMIFVNNLAHLNLTNLLNRFVPTAGPRAPRLVMSAYAVASGLAILAALVFVVGVDWFSPSLAEVVSEPGRAALFVVSTAAWTIFVLQDSVLVGLGRGVPVLIENVVYAVAKIALLVAIASAFPEDGIFLSWILPLPLLVIAVNAVVFRRMLPRHTRTEASEPLGRGVVARFVAADHLSSLLWTASATLIPVIVLEVSGAAASAFVFTAWTIAYTVYLVSKNMGMALITAGAREPHRLGELTRQTIAGSMLLVLPAVAVLLAGAPWVLALFGSDYSANASTLLRLFALSAVPYVVTSTFLSIARVQRRMTAVLVVTSTMSLLLLVLSVAMLHLYDLAGVGWAWVVGQSAVAVVLLVTEFRSMWVSRLDLRRIEPLMSTLRNIRSGTRTTQVARDVETLIRESSLADRWNLTDVLETSHDVHVVGVESVDGSQRAVLRVPWTPQGKRAVLRHAAALLAVHGRDELGSARALVPDVLSAELDGSMPWLLERRLPGTPANAVVDSVGVDRLHHAVTAALQPVYADTVRSVVVDDDLLLEWVDRPLDRICRAGPRRRRRAAHVAGVERMRDDLHERLAGRSVACSFVHGDLWLGNVLVDPRSADVTALLDWDQSHEPGVPCVDVAHLLLTTRSVELRRPLGRVVLDGIRDATWSDRDRAVLARLPGGLDEMDPKTTILLAWIRHASGLLEKSGLYDRSVLWRAQNTDLVLEQA